MQRRKLTYAELTIFLHKKQNFIHGMEEIETKHRQNIFIFGRR